jgi:hypothetical protein
MAFTVGQRVEIAFNPPTPDPRVPDQLSGKAAGRGEYKTTPDFGEILAELPGGYLVAVELVQMAGKRKVRSVRQRVIPEAKLRAVS